MPFDTQGLHMFDEAECQAVLKHASVGRVGVAWGDLGNLPRQLLHARSVHLFSDGW